MEFADMEAVLTEPQDRSRAIIDRIAPVFAAKGFDGCSMQDLAQAANMSAGNFYRYFPSKSALVEALCQCNLEEMDLDLRTVHKAQDPRSEIRSLILRRIREDRDKGPLWAEIEAAAFRRPEIATLLDHVEKRVIAHILDVLSLISGVDREEAGRRFSAHARLIMIMVQGATIALGRPSEEGANDDGKLADLVVDTIDAMVVGMLAENQSDDASKGQS